MFTPRQAKAPPSNAFDSYRANLNQSPPLDRETERALARRYNDGDERAGVELIQACLPFVVSIAFEYRRWGAPLEDIVQEGNIGLLRAAKKFDPERDVRLVTYAAYWIRASIREYVVRAYRNRAARHHQGRAQGAACLPHHEHHRRRRSRRDQRALQGTRRDAVAAAVSARDQPRRSWP